MCSFRVADEVKGEIPLGFVVLKSGVTRDHKKIASELIGMVRERIGPIASFKNVVIINRLPKTRSGKILRSTMKKIADGETYTVPATIDDPAVLTELGGRLREAGFREPESCLCGLLENRFNFWFSGLYWNMDELIKITPEP